MIIHTDGRLEGTPEELNQYLKIKAVIQPTAPYRLDWSNLPIIEQDIKMFEMFPNRPKSMKDIEQPRIYQDHTTRG